MQIQPEISFHNLAKPDWAEDAILNHMARLEDILDRLITCRVRVDQRANNSNNTVPPVVRIELSVPGHDDIVVAHEPDRLQRKFQAPDLHNAINEAFRVAERRLAQYKDQLQDRTAMATHEAAHEYRGQVAELHPEKDFGFILNASGSLLYFHRNSILSGDFDRLKMGTTVHYVEEVGDTGPIATKVRVKE
ncbi:MAG: HPF/RaiA family ribosome-associated protein [Alphaproteobacteria bacterium]|nr:HPF/RaiA family ribosome-associated protein [Alphaproteobacteria bacterium]